ncbi:hypothetical protein AHiyo6_13310 [Arthrobacter sp. Hiyo6]|nr:hypothetical protein AHiyo6_13310 [Arthrobacter sp. Hiyo6]
MIKYQAPDRSPNASRRAAAGTGGDRLPTLAAVARAAGPEFVSLVEMPAGDLQTVSGSVLIDPTARPLPFPGAIALAIGLSMSGKRLESKLQEIKDAGYVAVVYKANGASDEGLRLTAHTVGMALFRASDSVPWDQLMEIMNAAVAPHRESGRTLVDIRPGDLFDLANTVASQAGGAVAIADPEQTILAYSTLPDQPIDDTRRDSILRLQVPRSAENDADYRLVHAARDVVSVPNEEPSLRRSAIAIRAGDVVLGSLWLLETASNPNADAARFLREAANVAALHILHRRTAYVSTLARQIDLVKPLLFEPGRVELAAIRLGISADTIRIVAVSVWPPQATHRTRCSPG